MAGVPPLPDKVQSEHEVSPRPILEIASGFLADNGTGHSGLLRTPGNGQLARGTAFFLGQAFHHAQHLESLAGEMAGEPWPILGQTSGLRGALGFEVFPGH